jgi:hypothetical protein
MALVGETCSMGGFGDRHSSGKKAARAGDPNPEQISVRRESHLTTEQSHEM